MICETCGRQEATNEDYKQYAEGEGDHLCWGDPFSCTAGVRIVTLEAERDRYRDALRLIVSAADQGHWQDAVDTARVALA